MADLAVRVAALSCPLVAAVVTYRVPPAGKYIFTGDVDDGRLTSALYVGLCVGALLLGGWVSGSVLHTVVLGPASSRLPPPLVRPLVIASALWTATCAALVPVSACDAVGVSVMAALDRSRLVDIVLSSDRALCWAAAAMVSAAVTIRVATRSRRTVVLWLWLFTLPPLLPSVTVGGAAIGPDHDLATSPIAVFLLIGALGVGWSWQWHRGSGPDSPETPSREMIARNAAVTVPARMIMIVALITLVTVASPAGSRTGSWSAVTFAVGPAALLLADVVAGSALTHLARPGSAAARLIHGLVAAARATMVTIVIVALLTPPPIPRSEAYSIRTSILGFDLPPPSVMAIVSTWRFDMLFGGAAVLLLVAYRVGIERAQARGPRWPRRRSACWYAGVSVLVVSTCSGLAPYGHALFSVHHLTHAALGMLAPLLLVLGRPLTLVFAAVPSDSSGRLPSIRFVIEDALGSRSGRAIGHPATAVALFAALPFLVYGTPLYDSLVFDHRAQVGYSALVFVAGVVFMWVVVGADRGPRRLPIHARVGILLSTMPLHTLLAVMLIATDRAIGQQFYALVHLGWDISSEDDQIRGGVVSFAASTAVMTAVIVVLAGRWIRDERRSRGAGSIDPNARDDADPYTAMLDALASTRR